MHSGLHLTGKGGILIGMEIVTTVIIRVLSSLNDSKSLIFAIYVTSLITEYLILFYTWMHPDVIKR